MARLRAVPEVQKITVEVLDPSKDISEGATIEREFIVYVKGAGAPVPVVIEVEGVWADYDENFPTAEERANLSVTRYVAKARRAEFLLRRDLLRAVTHGGIDEDVVNMMATEDGAWKPILHDSGWYVIPEDIGEDEVKEEGEVVGVDETGESTSLTLVPSTPELIS